MSLEAIRKVAEIEEQVQERKLIAEAEAHQMIADAEKAGAVNVQKTRNEVAENAKLLLKQAEERATEKTAEIQRAAEAESSALREKAAKHMEEAVEFIVGRVVNH